MISNFTHTRTIGLRHLILIKLFSVSLILFLSSPTIAGDVIFELANVDNDPSAQFLLGKRYLHGNGVDQSYTLAAKWLTRAADQDHTNAQYEKGLLYKEGNGVKRDYQSAYDCFLKAAQKKHTKAMFELGNYYFYGLDGPIDKERAKLWYMKAAKNNHTEAQLQVDKILNGNSLITSVAEPAVKKIIKPAKKLTLLAPDTKPSETTPKAKPASSENQQLVKYLKAYPSAPDITKPDLQYQVGLLYLNGQGLKQNTIKAIYWFEKAAEKKYAKAQFELGMIYAKGIGVDTNHFEAHKWLSKAARNGLDNAKEELISLTAKE